jgi:hypothetical protein
MTIQDNQCGAAFGLAKDLEGMLDAVHVIGISDAQDVPTVCKETGRYILGEGDVSVTFDGDVVVIENPAEVVEPQVARERGRL